MPSRGGRKTTFQKLQRERERREKQAAKRARRQGGGTRPSDEDPEAIRRDEPAG